MIQTFLLNCFLISLILANYSCTKDVSRQEKKEIHNLGFFQERTIKIDQKIVIYDSTSIRDSIDFVSPPSKNFYEWNISPANGCAAFSGNYRIGMPGITFKCSGTYFISALIYDSITRNLVGVTDTVSITVTNDTLRSKQPIYADDTLNITPSIVKIWRGNSNSSTSPPDEVLVQMVLSTNRKYDYYTPYIKFDIDSTVSNNNYSFKFAESIRLTTYPFAYGYGVKDIVWGSISLHNLTIGVPATISFTWLGVTYNGSITLLNQNQFSFILNDVGAIKVR